MLNVSLIGTDKETNQEVIKIESILYVAATQSNLFEELKADPRFANVLENENVVFNLLDEDEDELLECNQYVDLELQHICDYIDEVCPYVSMYELVLDEGIGGLDTIDDIYGALNNGDIVSYESKEEMLYNVFEGYICKDLNDSARACLDLVKIEEVFLSDTYCVEDEDGMVWEILI